MRQNFSVSFPASLEFCKVEDVAVSSISHLSKSRTFRDKKVLKKTTTIKAQPLKKVKKKIPKEKYSFGLSFIFNEDLGITLRTYRKFYFLKKNPRLT